MVRWRRQPSRGRTNRRYVAENPPSGAQFWYSLADAAESVEIRISDVQGEIVNVIRGGKDTGLNVARWNLSRAARPRQAQGGRPQTAQRPANGVRGNRRGSIIGNGSYKATLVVDDEEVASHVISLKSDPELPAGAVSDQQYETMLLQDEIASQLKWDAKSEGRDVYQDD